MAQTINSVCRAFALLGLLADAEGSLTIREIASKMNLAPSTVHRLLQSLEASDALVKDPTNQRYRLGPAVRQLGCATLQDLDIRTVALPHMERLRETSSETVGLSVRIDDARVYVEQLQSRHELTAVVDLGHRYPLYSGAPGYALLAALDDTEVEAFLDRANIVPPTTNAPQDAQGIRQAVARVRSHASSMAFEETVRGINTVAVPILTGVGIPAAALSISGPAQRFSRRPMQSVVAPLREVGREISRSLGAPKQQGSVPKTSGVVRADKTL